MDGVGPTDAEALAFASCSDTAALTGVAGAIRDRAFGNGITYSKKVFIPLTHLCRDVCHYCTFAKAPRSQKAPFMTMDEVLEVASRGTELGCKEALFTLGEKPELRYPAAK
jgi:FO synthase